MKTESFNEPQCMTKSTINKQEFNFMISGNDVIHNIALHIGCLLHIFILSFIFIRFYVL